MERDNLNADENQPNDSPSVEEIGSNFENINFADNVDVPQISQSVGNIVDDASSSSHINSHNNVMHQYPIRGDHQSPLHRPESEFIDQQVVEERGIDYDTIYSAIYVGELLRQSPQTFNLPELSQYHQRGIVSSVGNSMTDGSYQINNYSNIMPHYPHEGVYHSSFCGPTSSHTPFNLNSPERLSGTPMIDLNVFPPDEVFHGEYFTSNSGSNTNVAGESQRGFIAPHNTHGSIMDRGGQLYPNVDVNSSIYGYQSSSIPMHGLPHNVGGWMQSTDNHNLAHSTRFAQSLLLSGRNQNMQHQFSGSPSTVMVGNQPLYGQNQPMYGQRPENIMNSYVNTSLQHSASPTGMATSGMSHSNLERQALMRNMIAQDLRRATSSSLMRDTSQTQSYVPQAHQRPMIRPHIASSVSTLSAMATPFSPTTQARVASPIPTSPNTYLSAPYVPHHTSATIPAPLHARTRPSSSHARSHSQTIYRPHRPQMTQNDQTSSATIPAPHHARTRPSSSRARSHSQTIYRPHQPQMTQNVLQVRTARTAPPSVPQRTVSPPHQVHLRLRDILELEPQGEPLRRPLTGHKCFLCQRDLSFSPDGPIHQPSLLPVSSVLPCGHTFHDECLMKITPQDLISEPPCIPCALGE